MILSIHSLAIILSWRANLSLGLLSELNFRKRILGLLASSQKRNQNHDTMMTAVVGVWRERDI